MDYLTSLKYNFPSEIINYYFFFKINDKIMIAVINFDLVKDADRNAKYLVAKIHS